MSRTLHGDNRVAFAEDNSGYIHHRDYVSDWPNILDQLHCIICGDKLVLDKTAGFNTFRHVNNQNCILLAPISRFGEEVITHICTLLLDFRLKRKYRIKCVHRLYGANEVTTRLGVKHIITGNPIVNQQYTRNLTYDMSAKHFHELVTEHPELLDRIRVESSRTKFRSKDRSYFKPYSNVHDTQISLKSLCNSYQKYEYIDIDECIPIDIEQIVTNEYDHSSKYWRMLDLLNEPSELVIKFSDLVLNGRIIFNGFHLLETNISPQEYELINLITHPNASRLKHIPSIYTPTLTYSWIRNACDSYKFHNRWCLNYVHHKLNAIDQEVYDFMNDYPKFNVEVGNEYGGISTTYLQMYNHVDWFRRYLKVNYNQFTYGNTLKLLITDISETVDKQGYDPLSGSEHANEHHKRYAAKCDYVILNDQLMPNLPINYYVMSKAFKQVSRPNNDEYLEITYTFSGYQHLSDEHCSSAKCRIISKNDVPKQIGREICRVQFKPISFRMIEHYIYADRPLEYMFDSYDKYHDFPCCYGPRYGHNVSGYRILSDYATSYPDIFTCSAGKEGEIVEYRTIELTFHVDQRDDDNDEIDVETNDNDND